MVKSNQVKQKPTAEEIKFDEVCDEYFFQNRETLGLAKLEEFFVENSENVEVNKSNPYFVTMVFQEPHNLARTTAVPINKLPSFMVAEFKKADFTKREAKPAPKVEMAAPTEKKKRVRLANTFA